MNKDAFALSRSLSELCEALPSFPELFRVVSFSLLKPLSSGARVGFALG